MIRWALLVLALLSGCGGAAAPRLSATAAPRVEASQQEPTEATAPRAGLSRPPTLEETRLIRKLMRETERIRGLSFIAPIDIRIQDRTAMRAYVSEALEEEDLASTRRRYVALGLIDPSIDIRELLESLMEEELIGYYDPRAKRLAVRDDVARSLGHAKERDGDLEWKATVVHELVHALQDQHLGLGEQIERERSTDADNAFGALVEGDATLAMLAYAAELAGVSIETIVADPRTLAESLDATPDRLTGALRRAPPLVREPLLFRYRDGALFAARLLARGGWRAVDEAHRKPPQTTIVISEPARYIEHRDVAQLALPDPAWLGEHGYRSVDQDSLGSFEVGVALGEAGLDARSIARAWRGDVYAVLEHAGGDASVWYLRFSDRTTARKAATALAEHRDTVRGERMTAHEGMFVLVAHGIDPAVHPALLTRFRDWARSP